MEEIRLKNKTQKLSHSGFLIFNFVMEVAEVVIIQIAPFSQKWLYKNDSLAKLDYTIMYK